MKFIWIFLNMIFYFKRDGATGIIGHLVWFLRAQKEDTRNIVKIQIEQTKYAIPVLIYHKYIFKTLY